MIYNNVGLHSLYLKVLNINGLTETGDDSLITNSPKLTPSRRTYTYTHIFLYIFSGGEEKCDLFMWIYLFIFILVNSGLLCYTPNILLQREIKKFIYKYFKSFIE